MNPTFPGMNPYLEPPELWTEVHSWLIVQLARSLNPILKPKYRAAVEKWLYSESLLVGIPDVAVFQPMNRVEQTATKTAPQPVKVNVPMTEEIQESYLEIRQAGTGQVITVVEVLSPKNKRGGEGRDKYNTKRTKILDSQTHLVEIDLIRVGEPQPISIQVQSNYRILVSRAEERPEAALYPFNLRDAIPQFQLPLLAREEEPWIDLKELLDEIYDEAALDLAIDYSIQPIPPLSVGDFQWVQELLH